MNIYDIASQLIFLHANKVKISPLMVILADQKGFYSVISRGSLSAADYCTLKIRDVLILIKIGQCIFETIFHGPGPTFHYMKIKF